MTEYEEQIQFEAQQQAEEEGKRLELEGCAAEHEAEARDREYERLKEEIIATAAGYTDDIKALTIRLMTIIAERCVIVNEVVFPSNPYPSNKTDWSDYRREAYSKAQDDMYGAGWRPVKSLKEAK